MTTQLSVLAETLSLTFTDAGAGRPYLLLHGGAGPGSMAGLAGALAKEGRSILPTHPGFDGQPRPEWFCGVRDLATAYLDLIERLDLEDVVLVGNSIGGWIAMEMGLRGSSRISGLVLLNAVGIEPNEETGEIADPAKLGPKVAAYAFYDPERFAIVPTGPDAAATMARNRETLSVYAGGGLMYDPQLRGRLPQLITPTLVVWGESDRIVTPAYGRELAGLIPSAVFETVKGAGHFPQIEQLDTVVELCKTLEPA